MRFAIPLLAALAMITLVACSGGDDETAAPVPLAQRFVSAEEAPGSKADPVMKRETTTDYAIFIPVLKERAINPDPDEMSTVFKAEDFKSAGVDVRFYGAKPSPCCPRRVVSTFVELSSDDAATSALDWSETEQMKPCPMSCAVQRSSFDVDDIPEARGVHRVATAEDIERVGAKEERPIDSYWIGFTSGPLVYTVELYGLPGSVSEEQAQQIASAYYDRLTGN